MLYRIIIILLITSFNLIALADEVLLIKNVKISATDKNASTARNVAIQKGQLRAFAELVKLHYPAAVAKAGKLSADQILDTVEGFELSNEKRSATQYFAKMNVKFREDNVSRLMNNLGASYVKGAEAIAVQEEAAPVAMAASPSMESLVIPVLEKDGQIYWFDDENIWFNFWQKKLQHSKSNQFILPIGDLEDISMLNKDILHKNIIDLAPLFERYNINNIALLKLKIIDDNVNLQIDYINRFNHSWQQYNFPEVAAGSDVNALMTEYYTEVLQYKFNEKQSFADGFEIIDPKTIIVDYHINKLSDWIELEGILNDIKYVTNVELKKSSLSDYRFHMTYNIAFDKLQHILRKANFVLNDDGENHYTISKEVADAKY